MVYIFWQNRFDRRLKLIATTFLIKQHSLSAKMFLIIATCVGEFHLKNLYMVSKYININLKKCHQMRNWKLREDQVITMKTEGEFWRLLDFSESNVINLPSHCHCFYYLFMYLLNLHFRIKGNKAVNIKVSKRSHT